MEFLRPERVRARLGELGEQPVLAASNKRWLDDDEIARLREAAVLIPLVERDGQLYVLVTKRSAMLRNHSGEFAFPGGRRDDEDVDLRATALREAEEEVALRPASVRVFGALTQMPTVTGFVVTSFVGEYEPDVELVHNPGEIELLVEIPLGQLLDPAVHRTQDREWRGAPFVMHFFEWRGHIVWGATALMLYELLVWLRGCE